MCYSDRIISFYEWFRHSPIISILKSNIHELFEFLPYMVIGNDLYGIIEDLEETCNNRNVSELFLEICYYKAQHMTCVFWSYSLI